jgi:hypothetical protein
MVGHTWSDLLSVGASMPLAQLVVFAVAITVWLGGGELLLKWHQVRRGGSWMHKTPSFSLPLKNFDGLEWAVGVFIVVLTLTLSQIGFALGR